MFPIGAIRSHGTKPPLHQHKRGRNTRYHRGRQNRLYRGKHSPQQLAEKIEYLIDHPMICAEMGKAGKEKFQREFTLEKFENRMKDILKECIASYKK